MHYYKLQFSYHAVRYGIFMGTVVFNPGTIIIFFTPGTCRITDVSETALKLIQ
jgi:hypothetical protein